MGLGCEFVAIYHKPGSHPARVRSFSVWRILQNIQKCTHGVANASQAAGTGKGLLSCFTDQDVAAANFAVSSWRRSLRCVS